LANTNFALVNPRFAASEKAERNAMVSAGWEANYVDRLMNELKGVMHGFTDTVARLAKDLPDVKFLLRPHPFEDVSFYAERLSTLPNLEINGAGDVLTVLLNSRCLLHLNCATAIEAVMLKRLPVSIEYLNTATLLNHAPLPSRVSKHSTSYQDALSLLSNLSQSAHEFDFVQRYDEFIYPWFYKNDGRAADRIAEIIHDRVVKRGKRSLLHAIRASRNQPRAAHYVQGLVANIGGSLAYSRLRSLVNPKRRDKNIDVGLTYAALRTLCEVDGRLVPIVRRASHPLTGLPLASICCSAE
jgi:hypothetical protein